DYYCYSGDDKNGLF
nr:immunoglobulin light chain junction region [Macaca mulatta]